MGKSISIKLEIGPGLGETIRELINTVDKENSRMSRGSLSPGEEVQKAFGIDITDMVKRTIELKVDRYIPD